MKLYDTAKKIMTWRFRIFYLSSVELAKNEVEKYMEV